MNTNWIRSEVILNVASEDIANIPARVDIEYKGVRVTMLERIKCY